MIVVDRGGGGALPLLPRRRGALHGPGDLDGGPGRARLGHRARLRRVHALPRGARVHGELDGAHPPLARPLRRVARASTRPRTSCSTGSCRAASTRTCAPSPPPTSTRRRVDGIAIGGSLGQSKEQMREVVGWSLRGLARRAAAPPARDRRRGRPRPRGGRGHRHLRLRHAHAAGAPRHRARAGPGRALAARPHQGAAPHEPRADRRGLPLPRLPRAHARLPALPAPRRRADRRAAAHAPQPDLHGAPDARAARGDRGAAATPSTRRASARVLAV